MAFVDDILHKLKSSNNEEKFLNNFLTETPIGSLLKVCSQIEEFPPQPYSKNAMADAIEAYDHLRCHYFLPEAEELVRLMAKPHMKSLLECHDMIGNKQYEPILPQVPYEVDEDDVTVKIVNLVKHNEPLGATIKINENGAVKVARVMHGGVADRSTSLSVGDEILEINNFSVAGRGPMEVIQMLTTISGDVKIKLFPSTEKKSGSDINLSHVRALFSYSPSMDQLIPCREAGLAFRKGDILRLVNTEDPHWWQAVKLDTSAGGISTSMVTSSTGPPGSGGKTGLIPSRALQQMKEQYRENSGNNSKLKDPNSLPAASSTDLLIYEDVDIYFAEERNYRPIVLIGPNGVGKDELKQKLINTDQEHFKEPIRITTREPEQNEVHGQDFLFVTRDEFDTFQQADSLVDQHESFGDLYGLCLDAVLDVIQSGQVAVLAVQAAHLSLLRVASIKPFVVYVKPPPFDVLLETRSIVSEPGADEECEVSKEDIVGGIDNVQRSFTKLQLARQRRNGFTEGELKDMLQSSSRMELTYGHLFDFVVVNDDFPVALELLSKLAYRLETEQFWVPKRWLTDDSSAASSSIGVFGGDLTT